MTLLHAIVLGILQGLTEFIPVSSSAHLILLPWALRWQPAGLAFDVFLHGGTLVAVTLYFGRDWWQFLRGGIASVLERKIGYDRDRILFWLLVLGTLPAAAAGLWLEDTIESAFRAPLLIAINLAALGFLLYWFDGRSPSLRSLEDIDRKDALWIGIAQAFALFPGISRSGATMTMARLRGLNRESAARFSFLLSFPITLGAFLHKVPEVKRLAVAGALPWPTLLGGFFASMISGLLAIHLLLQYVRIADFRVFAWYRVLVAAAVVGWSLYCSC